MSDDLEKRVDVLTFFLGEDGKAPELRTFKGSGEAYAVYPEPRTQNGRVGPVAFCFFESDAKDLCKVYGGGTVYKKVEFSARTNPVDAQCHDGCCDDEPWDNY